MADYSKKNYYEAQAAKGSDEKWRFRIYHYDITGNKEVIVVESGWDYRNEGAALDAATDWMDENDVDAELA